MFIFDGKTFKPFKTNADDYLLRYRVRNGAALPDGTFAFGTQQGGVVIIDPKGRVLTIINENNGLINNHVRNLYSDHKGGLWLSLNDGISRIEIPSPFSRFGESFGIKGYIEDIKWQYGRLYVATSLGVYYLPLHTPANQMPTFHKVSDVPPKAWHFLEFENKFLVATGDGVCHIRKNGEVQLLTHSFSSLLYTSKKYPDRIYVALSEGISFLQYKNGQWYSTGQLKGTFGAIRTMIEDEDGALWLGTEQNGVQRIKFQEPSHQNSMDESIPDFEIDYYGQKDGIVPDDVDIFYYRDQIHFAALKGLWRFDAKSNRFLHDLSLGPVVGDTSRWIGRTVEDENGWLWLENGDDEGGDVGVLIPQDDGTFHLKTSPFEKISKEDVWLIFPDPKFKGTVWFGGELGLLKYDASIAAKNDIAYNALIRSVIVYPKSGKDSVIFGGTQMAANGKKFTNPILPYADNSMRFEYSAPFFSDPEVTQYQFFLEGFDENWSTWTREVKKDYTNLPEGKYQFKVKAINLYNKLSSEAVFGFEILPPWWRTLWAYIIYGILFLALLKGIDVIQRKRLIEREHLKAKEKELKQANKIKKAYKKLKATQSQLIQSEKMASLGELTAGIAHEIQNPLNFVNNFSEVSNELIDEMNEEIAKGDLDEAKAIAVDIKQNLEKITHHGKRAEAIVKGMLQHSRSSTGIKEPTDINSLVDEYFRLAYHGLRAKNKSFNATMKSDFDETVGNINVIPQDIGRVILNLITNAFYAVNEKNNQGIENYLPTVSVNTKKSDHKVLISVSDNGNGMPQNVLDKIFHPFFTTKPTGQGTGLGLSMSYDIVTKGHGGELEVETKEGEGTIFTIEIPI
jgi:signal transduction histidine kinase